ncbi:hypothetical protein CMI37_20465 [Candidatus Pacearchaeota archaeon]|jgi:hypothetical protein|nr:hypothetical protein [Candidatus Pacearchaeota archaeon]|tara:strand:- start:2880 stop:3323 length:444 start_codon:yes stop_codon:yes gene_type:complete
MPEGIEQINGIVKADNDALIKDYVALTGAIADLAESRSRIEWELTRRMEADGATAIPNERYEVLLAPSKVTYDYGKLVALFETVSEADLVAAGAYTPEHDEPVPAKWNATKLKPFRKFGNDVKTIIDGARLEGPKKLSIKERKGVPA